MPKCIFSGADETAATFSEREHIFPKCIGGVRCLPLGYVSDEINHSFSKMELGFARENPIVVTRRMFSPPMGRKKHTNREKIGIMRDTDHGTGYHLGIVRNCTPISLNQLVITSELPPEIPKGFPVHVILAPSATLTHEQQAIQFWKRLSAYWNWLTDRLPYGQRNSGTICTAATGAHNGQHRVSLAGGVRIPLSP